MGTWLKRSASKKYVVNNGNESMDQILEGLLESQQPEGVKSAIIAKVIEQGSQQSAPGGTVRGVFQVSCKWILHGTSSLQVSSGFKLLNSWGSHHLESFQCFFTPELVGQMLSPGHGTEANIPLLIREGFRVMSLGGPQMYHDHAQRLQRGVTKFVCSTDDRMVVRNMGLLLQEFNESIPSDENEVTNFCLAILHHLGIGVPPLDRKECLRFITRTDEIAFFLSTVWKLNAPSLLGDCLAEIFRIISESKSDDQPSEPAICLASVVKYVPIELANRVVKDVVMDTSISDESIVAAVGQIAEWLKWPTAKNVDLWLSCFLTELAAAHKYRVLVQITEANVDQVVENIAFPHMRGPSFNIFSQMLLSFQHSPGPFHKSLDKIPNIIATLKRENTKDSESYLVKMSQLIHCLMYQHTGFPELYDPVLELIKNYPSPSTEEIKTKLQNTRWSSQVSGTVAMETTEATTLVTPFRQEKLETGKTGLENLGNTCYMNSVLQALYMCDQFRRGVLGKCPTPGETLLVKLQHVFALVSQSSRPAIAPRKFLLASRPPWFLPGHQQDCSEFLKYLLDQLHEDEKSATSVSQGHGTKDMKRSPSTGSISPTGSIKASKSSRKEAVTLMGVKMRTDDDVNGFNTPGGCVEKENCANSSPLSLVEKTFRGKVQTTMRCLWCKQESKRVESFSDIPLAFPNSSKSSEYPLKSLAGGSGVPDATCSSEGVQAEKDSGDKDTALASEDCFTLNDLISFYLKPEKLTGDNKYHCDHCGKLQDGERSIHITESPQYLILTLLRFSYDTKLQKRTKIFQDVRYPRTLAIPVCENEESKPSPSKAQHSRANSKSSINSNTLKELAKLESIAGHIVPEYQDSKPACQKNDLYGLSAVVVHSGTSSECGHYYCYARHSQAGQIEPSVLNKVSGDLESLDLLPDKWYNFNDSRVSHANFESFSNVTKRFSKDTAYVLVYRKLDLWGQGANPSSDMALRSDLREAVTKDNEIYLQEQEIDARAREEQRRRSASVSSASMRNWRDDDDDDNKPGGPPGCGGGFGGGLDTSGSRFVF